jgi:preprotein translocase subunit SecD
LLRTADFFEDFRSEPPLVKIATASAPAETFSVTIRLTSLRAEEPPGGAGQISGNFTVESANNLAILMRGGMFPARLTVVEQQVIEGKSEAAPK